MTGRLRLLCLLLTVPATACATTPCDRLDAAHWLPGAWTADGAVVDSEALRLLQLADAVFYVAKVAHNPYPVGFRLTECGDGLLVFENPQHDFPRRLRYERTTVDRMTVTVSDGGAQSFELRFVRHGTAHATADPP